LMAFLLQNRTLQLLKLNIATKADVAEDFLQISLNFSRRTKLRELYLKLTDSSCVLTEVLLMG
jgi:hypothetical protein